MKEKKRVLLLVLVLWLLPAFGVRAQLPGEKELDLEELQRSMQEILDTNMDLNETIQNAAEGGSLFSPRQLAGRLLEQIRAEWSNGRNLILSAAALCICASLLTNFSGIFKNHQIAEVSFELTYVLLFLLLLRGFRGSLQVASEALAVLGDFMKILVPSYFLAVTMASSPLTAGAFYPLVLGLIYGVRWFLETLLVPLLSGYMLLIFVDHLTGEAYLSHFCSLIYSGFSWLLRSLLLLVAGVQMVQGIISPAVDAFRTTAASKIIAGIPGVGNTAGAAADLVLGSGMLIKNGIGALGLLAILLICAVPMVKLAVWVLLLKGLAAVTEPVTDKRINGCIADASRAGFLLLRIVFTAAALFMLSIAVTAAATGLGR